MHLATIPGAIFAEGNARKSTVSFAFYAHVDVNARSIFAIFFFVIERSVLMALVFYNKRMLER